MLKKVSIGVGGRFHADHMLEELLNRGYEATLYTTIPPSRFSRSPKEHIVSFLTPEIIYRLASRIGFENWGNLYKMKSFGSFFASEIKNKPDEILMGWSSFSLEAFKQSKAKKKILIRDSAHIDVQMNILKTEYKKLGTSLPDRAICQVREREEYELADYIFLPSFYAKKTFIDCGIPEKKLKILRLAVDLKAFTPPEHLEINLPLKVVYFGALSIQKGVHYLLKALESFSPNEVQATFIGSLSPEIKPFIKKNSPIRFISPVNHSKLSALLKEQQIFIFPSLHDGYGMTLPQAMASGLLCLSSTHAGASELISHNKNGILIQPGSSEEIREHLQNILINPKSYIEMRRLAIKSVSSAGWNSYGDELNRLLIEVCTNQTITKNKEVYKNKIEVDLI